MKETDTNPWDIGLLFYTGAVNIVNNSGLVIIGNKLDVILEQNEVDHLN